jgi:hypothetical protein
MVEKNDNRHFLETYGIDKGITRVVLGPNAKAPAREMPPGILPANGSLRATPSAAFGRVDVKGNRTGK